MGGESDITKQVSGIIPHFWYDILGRIVPGGFLLVGLFSEDWRQSLTAFVHKFAAEFPLTTHSVGFFMLFSVASFFVGHFLGVLSYSFIAWPIKLIRPVKIESVPVLSELPVPERLRRCMESFSPNTSRIARIGTHNMLAKQSEALAHWLWVRSPDLAILLSRWASEALAGRSVALASVIVLLSEWSCLTRPVAGSLMILFLCGVATHYHYRNKNITNAFYFSTMLESNPGGETPKAK